MWHLSLLLIALLVVLEPLAFAGQTKAVRIRWADLDNLVRGQRVSVSTTGGATCKGTAQAIDSDSLPHKGRDKVLAGILAVGGLPLGLLAGYLLGRQIDKEVTVIRIIPE
jgi:uncharacterized protein with ACT and thioredoxin-like domain